MSVRFVTHSTKGYSLVEASGDDSPDPAGARRYISIHRLAAFAWGELEDVLAEEEIHHCIPCPWYNAEENLLALPSDEHARITREQAQERREVTA